MFAGRQLVIATKHQKEKVIGPVLERASQAICSTTQHLDTDQLGTFTGETERQTNALICARKKCLLALEESGHDLAVASEGSFGPHSSLIFVPADEELILLVDKKHDLEIAARLLSTSTNYQGKQIASKLELSEFLAQVQFPSHAVIIRSSQNNFEGMEKGVTNLEQLQATFNNLLQIHKSVYVETDMRAMYNPTRMKVIEETAILLSKKMNSLCPECSFPGFDITQHVGGLLCSNCKMPTKSTLFTVSTCKKCNWSSQQNFPRGKKNEDPTFCHFCNP